MSRVFVCLFVVVIFCIAAQFGNCENANQSKCEDENITPSSDKTRLSFLEIMIKELMKPISIVDKLLGKSPTNITGSFGVMLEKFSKHVHFIYPGTLWCGGGDIASRDSDLGFFKETDKCCRAHDNCQSNILATNSLINVQNNGLFTRSACFCDYEFYKCLKFAKNPIASKIGCMYFDILQPQCFKCVCPKQNCNPIVDEMECKDRCEKYEWTNNLRFMF